MSQVRQVKEAIDIVEVIGERIALVRAGSSLRGLCPFHSEKSPSFFVSDQFQRYKCFGCGENGDVFTFLERYEGMTFNEALQYLAERAGITLTSYQPTAEDEQRQRLLAILNLTKEYYHYVLVKHDAGAPAREYLKSRGVHADSIRLFQLGYALPGWDGLLSYLHKKKKYSLADLSQAGLIVTGRTGKEYDRFRNRLMFPLTNHRGQVVGFSGRLLDSSAKEAKYINSPETQLYHKSEMLYGYSELFQEIRKKKEVVVVEGEFDVISSTQAHVNHVVAIKGSALTSQHLQLMNRAAERILFSLDMDSAGVAATKRAIQMGREFNLDMRVVVLPNGKDPDDLARTAPAEWREAVKSSLSVYEYLIRASVKQHPIDKPEGKRAIIDELAPIIGTITHAVEQDVYIRRLAEELKVREELVRQDILRFRGNPLMTGLSSSSSSTAAAPVNKPAAGIPVFNSMSRQPKLEAYLLFLFFHSPETHQRAWLTDMSEIIWSTPEIPALLKQLQPLLADKTVIEAVRHLPADQQQLVFELSSQPDYLDSLEQLDLEKEWKRTLSDLFQEQIKTQIARINTELEQLEAAGAASGDQEAKQTALLQEIVTLRRKLSAKTTP